MVQRKVTGHERSPDGFSFQSLRVPPDNVLPPAVRKLTAELRDHQKQWRDADARYRELTKEDSRRTAEKADALLLGEAVRAGKEEPGPVNVDALAQAIKAAAQDKDRHESAGRLIAQELDQKLQASADKGAGEARDKIADARSRHENALADLEAARKDLINSYQAAIYWSNVKAGAPTRWRGRTDGRGTSLVAANGSHIPLENFAHLTAAITAEAARLTRAVHPDPDPDDDTPADNDHDPTPAASANQ